MSSRSGHAPTHIEQCISLRSAEFQILDPIKTLEAQKKHNGNLQLSLESIIIFAKNWPLWTRIYLTGSLVIALVLVFVFKNLRRLLISGATDRVSRDTG